MLQGGFGYATRSPRSKVLLGNHVFGGPRPRARGARGRVGGAQGGWETAKTEIPLRPREATTALRFGRGIFRERLAAFPPANQARSRGARCAFARGALSG